MEAFIEILGSIVDFLGLVNFKSTKFRRIFGSLILTLVYVALMVVFGNLMINSILTHVIVSIILLLVMLILTVFYGYSIITLYSK